MQMPNLIQPPAAKTLLFSIALNGYQWLYAPHIRSHRRYAQRHGFQHLVVDRPRLTRLGVECCWLKLCIMRQALQAGFARVLFVDADAYIQPAAPSIASVIRQDKLIYMANGYTGRFNSGVMFVVNHPNTLNWLTQVVASRQQPLPEQDSVGWGENGHVIYHARGCDFIAELATEWNNTFQPELADYIRHFNHGPMRSSLMTRLLHRLLSRSTRGISRLAELNLLHDHSDGDDLARLQQQALRYYPELQPDNVTLSGARRVLS